MEQLLDEDKAVFIKEKQLFKLIASRRGKLGVLTQKIYEINALIKAGDTGEEVKQLLDVVVFTFFLHVLKQVLSQPCTAVDVDFSIFGHRLLEKLFTSFCF